VGVAALLCEHAVSGHRWEEVGQLMVRSGQSTRGLGGVEIALIESAYISQTFLH